MVTMPNVPRCLSVSLCLFYTRHFPLYSGLFYFVLPHERKEMPCVHPHLMNYRFVHRQTRVSSFLIRVITLTLPLLEAFVLYVCTSKSALIGLLLLMKNLVFGVEHLHDNAGG